MDEQRGSTGGAVATRPDARTSTTTRPTDDLATRQPPPFGDRPWSGDAESRPEAVESLAAIDGHPLHPSIVPLPIGAFVGAFAADLAYARTRDPFWARASRHLTDAGIVTGLLAGALGGIDFTGRSKIRDREIAWYHMGGNLGVIGLALVSRMLRRRDERGAVVPAGLAISALSAAILGVTGWLGGELSYRYRIGVIPHDR